MKKKTGYKKTNTAKSKKISTKKTKKIKPKNVLKPQKPQKVSRTKTSKPLNLTVLEMLELPSLLYCEACGKEIIVDENILQEKVLVCCGRMMNRRD